MGQAHYVAVDTESTGLSIKKDRIVEFAATRFDPVTGVRGEQLHFYLNPGVLIPPEATKIHGITNEQVANAPFFKDVADQIQDFLHGSIFVAHNASYDTGIMDAELKRAKKGRIEERVSDVICTRRMANYVRPKRPATLTALCQDFAIDVSHRELHSALIDTELLAQVFPHLNELHAAKESIIEGLLPFGLGSELPEDLGTLARGYIALGALVNRLKQEQKRLKPLIVQMGNKQDLSGDGWSIKYGMRAGKLDYKAIIEELLADTDLSPYRGEDSETVKIEGNYPVEDDEDDSED